MPNTRISIHNIEKKIQKKLSRLCTTESIYDQNVCL